MYSATEGLMDEGRTTWVWSSKVGVATMLSNLGIFSPLVFREVRVSTLSTVCNRRDYYQVINISTINQYCLTPWDKLLLYPTWIYSSWILAISVSKHYFILELFILGFEIEKAVFWPKSKEIFTKSMNFFSTIINQALFNTSFQNQKF